MSESLSCFLSSSSFKGYLETVFTVLWRSNQGYVVIGSCGNDDWAVSKAADCTPVTMTMVVRVAETLKGPSAELPTTPCWHWRSMRSLMRAVGRAADYTLLALEIDEEFDEGCRQSRRLHPAGTGDRWGVWWGPSAEPPTTPCWHWRSMRSLMRAVGRAADYTLLALEIDEEFDEGRQQSRRLHPAGTGDRLMRSLMRAVGRAADYTLMTMKMVRVEKTKGRK